MRDLIEFSEFIRKGIIRKATPDENRANDLISEAERKSNSLNVFLKKIGLSDNTANDIMEYCYDILINLVRSKLFLEGYSSSGAGAHEAEVSYLKILGFSNEEVLFANQLRYFRNGIKYYGKRFDKEYAEKVLAFLEKARRKLG